MKPASPYTQCLNCGQPFDQQPEYCPACGQRVRPNPMPIRDFFSDFVQDYFTVDAKFFNSIGLLFFQPGALTARFNEGKRKSYIAPFRFYIFVSVVYFTLLALSVRNDSWDFVGNQKADLNEQLQRTDSLLQDSTLLTDPAALRAAYKLVRAEATADSLALDSLEGIPWAEINIGEGEGADNWFMAQKERIAEHPERFKQAVFKSGSVGVFFLLPVFGLLLMLFHYRRSKFYINHLVFSVHFHTFVFLIFTLFLALARLDHSISEGIWAIIFAFYLYLVARRLVISPASTTGKVILSWVLFIVFALLSFPFWLGGGDESGIAMVIFIISGYFTLSLIHAYHQSFNRAVAKSLLIIPVYGLILLMAFVVVVLGGVVLT